MLGVPNELVKVTCTGKPAQEGGIEGPVVTSVEFPASTTVLNREIDFKCLSVSVYGATQQ